jgi:putative FmdB family regulatory protein
MRVSSEGRHLFSTDAQDTGPDSSERPARVGNPTSSRVAGPFERSCTFVDSVVTGVGCLSRPDVAQACGLTTPILDLPCGEGPFRVPQSHAPAGRTAERRQPATSDLGVTMPIFEYRCSACGHLEEVLQKHSDPAPAACPRCSAANTMAKELSLSAFHLKGGGWYKDLYSSSTPASGSSGSSDSSSSVASTPVASAAPAAAGSTPAAAAPAASAPAAPAAPSKPATAA